ncbi:hypothetical protein [Bradyrhizobium ivorense]|uniref:hypothetical protein n=1 Tax=Bradyrhizobium ivorense TaxID=2511166 RepID=UPI0010BB5BDD|nr:hypothetical protein [Bradyrhizobium ivorense]VIO77763.1 hypothetical protein CI41S_60190 [Bradyrhizobium ivorense]
MKGLSVLCVVASLALSGTAAFARGGMGGMGSHMSMGGALGTSAARPGTNSLGTALPGSDFGNGHPMKGPPLGSSPAIDRDDARLQKMLEGSICRGC